MTNIVDFPKSSDQRVEIGLDHFRAGRFQDAINIFRELADQGFTGAFGYLGTIYEFADDSRIRNTEKAIFYYEQSISRTGAVPAYLGLIRIFLYGGRDTMNCEMALEYCQLVISQARHPLAHFYLGHMQAEGLGMSVALDDAIENFHKAWEGGYVFGMTFIGLVEAERRRFLRGWFARLRAGIRNLAISIRNPNDWRVDPPPHWTNYAGLKTYRY